MIRNIDPVGPAAGTEPNGERSRDNHRAAPRQDTATAPDATVVQLSGQALARRPGRTRVPPPDSWAGAMIDLVLDAASDVSEAIRQDPKQAMLAQAHASGDRALELTSR